MKRIFIALTLTVISLTAYALTDSWSVDVRLHTAVDRAYKQGESADMTVTLRAGFTPLDLSGSTAVFYWSTNAAQNVWWTNAAAVVSAKAGVVCASWTPAMDIGATNYPYWLGVWTPGATSPLWRVTGTIRLLPSPGVTPNALVPPVRTLDFNAVAFTNAPWLTAADWQSGSNALAGALHDVNTNLSVRIGVVSQSVEAVASDVSALSGSVASLGSLFGTNRITRWYDPELPTRFAEWDGGTNIVVYLAEVSATNYSVSLSADFLGSDGQRPAWTNNVWPFEDGVWRGMVFNMGGEYWYSLQNTAMTYAWDAYPPNPVTFPVVLSGVQAGTATVSSHYSYVTNIEWRYVLPTNAIPPELANIDNLQGWLNNLYAMKSVVDNAIATKEIHADSYTNLLWKSVFSNGWHWLVPYTNTP